MEARRRCFSSGHRGSRARWAHASKQAWPLCRKQALVINPNSTRLDRRMPRTSGDAVLFYGHQVSVAPTSLKPVKSDFTNGMSRRVESNRAKHEVQVGRVTLNDITTLALPCLRFAPTPVAGRFVFSSTAGRSRRLAPSARAVRKKSR